MAQTQVTLLLQSLAFIKEKEGGVPYQDAASLVKNSTVQIPPPKLILLFIWDYSKVNEYAGKQLQFSELWNKGRDWSDFCVIAKALR